MDPVVPHNGPDKACEVPSATPHANGPLQPEPLTSRTLPESTTERLEHRFTEYARRRAELLYRDEYGTKELAAHDREFIESMRGMHAELKADPKLRNQLFQLSTAEQNQVLEQEREEHYVELKEQLHALEEFVENTWEEIGSRRGRTIDVAEIEKLEQAQALEIERNAELFKRIPDLGKELLALKDRAMHSGWEMYLKADETCIRLYDALHWSQRDSSLAHQLLVELTPAERAVVRRVYPERYGIELEDAFKKAFVREMPSWSKFIESAKNLDALGCLREVGRVRNFCRPRDILRVTRELYGFEAGIITSLWKAVVDRRLKEAGFVQTLYQIVNLPEVSRAEALVREDRITVAADSIYLAIKRGVEPGPALATIFEELTEEEIPQVEQNFLERYADRFPENNLREIIEARFRADEVEYLFAMLDKDEPARRAVMVRQGLEYVHMRLDACKMFAELTDREMVEVKQAFEKKYGVPLDESHPMLKPLGGIGKKALSVFSGKGRLRTRIANLFRKEEPLLDCMALHIAGDRKGAAAMQLRWALRWRSKDTPTAAFYDNSETENLSIIEEYESRTGEDFWHKLRRKEGKERAEIDEALVRKGSLTEEELLRHCLAGTGTDARGALKILQGKSKRQQKLLGYRYSKRFSKLNYNPLKVAGSLWKEGLSTAKEALSTRSLKPCSGFIDRAKQRLREPCDLDADLKKNLSGHDLFDAQMMRRGTPRTAKQIHDNIIEQFEHERTIFSRLVLDWCSRDGRRVRQDIKRLKEYYEHTVDNQQPTEAELLRFRKLGEIAKQNFQALRARHSDIANSVGNLVNFGGLIAAPMSMAYIGFTGMQSIPYVAGATFLVSFMSRYVPFGLLMGRGYTTGKKLLHGALAGIDGGMLFLNRLRWFHKAQKATGVGRSFSAFLSRYAIRLGRTAIKLGLKKSMRNAALTSWNIHETARSSHVERFELNVEKAEAAARGNRFGERARVVLNRDTEKLKRQSLHGVWRKILREDLTA